jgi:hypothetical protein
MPITRRDLVTGGLGLCLLLALFRLWGNPHDAPPLHPQLFSLRAPISHHSPTNEALREARRWRLRAQVLVRDQLEALEEEDPDRMDGRTTDLCRRLLMARTRELLLARVEAARAAALARTPDEIYQTALLRAGLECDAGHHQAELRLARQLVHLKPRDTRALLALQHAAVCIGQVPLVLQRRVSRMRLLAPHGCAELSLCPVGGDRSKCA